MSWNSHFDVVMDEINIFLFLIQDHCALEGVPSGSA